MFSKQLTWQVMENGFLGSLRPYQGTLKHDAFHELMACIKTLGPILSQGESVDRQIIGNLWNISSQELRRRFERIPTQNSDPTDAAES